MNVENLVTIGEVVEMYKDENIEAYHVRYAIKTNKIKYVKKGWQILIDKTSLPKTWKSLQHNS